MKYLAGKALSIINFKGGTGKTTLIVSLASLASLKEGATIVVVDLDSSAPLTAAIFHGLEKENNIITALERASRGEEIEDLIFPAPQIGASVFVIKGYGRGAIPWDLVDNIPDLILEVKNTYINGRLPDYIMVDSPGENEEVNKQILKSVDAVAMSMAFTALDITASKRTMGLINLTQQERGAGQLAFLGFVPMTVARGTSMGRAIVADSNNNLIVNMISSGMLLPYIPASEHFKKTFAQTSKGGLVTVPGFAPNSKANMKLNELWEGMNSSNPDRNKYMEDLLEQLGLSVEDISLYKEPSNG